MEKGEGCNYDDVAEPEATVQIAGPTLDWMDSRQIPWRDLEPEVYPHLATTASRRHCPKCRFSGEKHGGCRSSQQRMVRVDSKGQAIRKKIPEVSTDLGHISTKSITARSWIKLPVPPS